MFVGCQESQASGEGSSSADRTDGLDNAGVVRTAFSSLGNQY